MSIHALLSKNYRSWGVSTILISVVLSLPLLVVIAFLVQPTTAAWEHLRNNVLTQYLSNTAYLLALSCLFSAIIGISLAWIVSSYQFRFRKALEWLLVVPLAIPTYLMAFTQANIFSYTGIAKRFLLLFNPDSAFYLDIMHIPGLALVLSLALYPYVYLPVRVILRGKISNYIDAARSMGVSEFKVFFRVLLPLARPAIAGGLFLVAMEVLNDFGAVKYFGINTLTTGIFSAWFSMGDLSAAIRLAALLLLFVFILMAVEGFQRRRIGFEEKSASHPTERRIPPFWMRQTLAAICWLVLLAALILPLIQLILDAFLTWQIIVNQGFALMVLRSIGLASLSSLIVVVLGLIIQFSKRLQSGRLLSFFSTLANTGYAIPGAVIAVGVLLLTGAIDRSLGSLVLTGGVSAMVYAYTVRFLAVSKGPLESGFSQSVQNADWASLSLGKSPLQTLRRIILPLVSRSTLVAALLVFVDVLKELPLTLILRPFNFYTLATRTYEYAADEMLAKAALPALCIIVAGTIPIALLNRYIDGPEPTSRA